jgi:hypothetical protein
MAYEFQSVDLSIFDFHAAVNALTNPASVRPEFQFLTDPAQYNARYQGGQPIETDGLRIRPMRWRAFSYHFFWKYYQLIHQTGQPDFWKLQMPFVCYPKQTEIKLHTGSQDFEGFVRPTVFLSAMGWATDLNIRLRGRMKPADVQEFVRRLANKPASPFEVDGARMILPEVFEHFTALVRGGVYLPNMVDALKVKRYMIMSLSQYSGDLAFYRGPAAAGVKQLPAADRALFHSMLRGAPVGVPDVIKLENERKFLITRFIDPAESNNPDFAITYFDYGTLVFMQRTASGSNAARWKARRGAMRCHASNIRNYLLMTLSLHAFYRDSASEAAASATVKDLRDSIKASLVQLPARYTNPFSQSFHGGYGPLQKLSQP